jgi:peptide chain release factor 3
VARSDDTHEERDGNVEHEQHGTTTSLDEAVRRRRTFAIISHPDAGKTTLTEKLLLYGGAIHLAGSVKARRAERHATSDWMELERQRGISVTSSVLQFEYGGYQINLLDTPGHQDFSEDTYRTLIAADSAVMLLDNRRGVEDRTRQLFDVCKRRRMPIFTFVNKCDRAGEDPLKLVSDVEADLGIACHPVTWPIHRDGAFVGVYDRWHQRIHLFDRSIDHGATRAGTYAGALDDQRVRDLLGAPTHERLLADIALLDEAGHPFDQDAWLAGELSPMCFGSALTNFGVEPFLEDFLELAPPPGARESSAGPVDPVHHAFTGFVFKIQANMDPRHRDRVAFLRVCSGRFEAGMHVTHVRTGKPMRLSAPQHFMARDRSAVEEAWPGDVIGVVDKGTLRIGDTLSANGTLEFSGIPHFAPEHFARIVVADPLRRKHLDTGLRQLTEEGAAQVFYADGDAGPTPIVGAVGLLQFDVMLHRLEHEYGVPCRLERLSYKFPRWVVGNDADIARVARMRGHLRLFDAKGNPLILFEDAWMLRSTVQHETSIAFHEIAP